MQRTRVPFLFLLLVSSALAAKPAAKGAPKPPPKPAATMPPPAEVLGRWYSTDNRCGVAITREADRAVARLGPTCDGVYRGFAEDEPVWKFAALADEPGKFRGETLVRNPGNGQGEWKEAELSLANGKLLLTITGLGGVMFEWARPGPPAVGSAPLVGKWKNAATQGVIEFKAESSEFVGRLTEPGRTGIAFGVVVARVSLAMTAIYRGGALRHVVAIPPPNTPTELEPAQLEVRGKKLTVWLPSGEAGLDRVR